MNPCERRCKAVPAERSKDRGEKKEGERRACEQAKAFLSEIFFLQAGWDRTHDFFVNAEGIRSWGVLFWPLKRRRALGSWENRATQMGVIEKKKGGEWERWSKEGCCGEVSLRPALMARPSCFFLFFVINPCVHFCRSEGLCEISSEGEMRGGF